MSWLNLLYGAPLGAPMALLLSGLLGFAAERVRNHPPPAALTAVGMLGTVGEARTAAFQPRPPKPAMVLPITVPPIAAGMLGNAALARGGRPSWVVRLWLRLTAALGIVGVGFHAFGVSRAMGGWRNWSQNLLNGPPLPAPPSFTGLAIAGLAALNLLEGEAHD
jgi:hypothetical protein